MSAEARFEEFVESTRVSLDALHELFDALPAVETAFLLGDWEGGVFATGHRGERQLGAIRWAGKRFHSEEDVDPIISRSADGGREVNPVLGKATLAQKSHRGVVTAAMAYSSHPIVDYFRKINDDLVLGVMDRRGDPTPLFFYLRRLTPAAPPSPPPEHAGR